MRIEVIGGLEEARLIFGAIRAAVVLDPPPAVCFDLGGGSLEVMVGDAERDAVGEQPAARRRAPHAELVHSDPMSKADRRALRGRIREELEPVAAARPHPGTQARGRE